MIVKENQPVDAAALMRAVDEIQTTFAAALTPDQRAALPPQSPSAIATPVYSIGEQQQALEDFALTTAAESLELLAGQVEALVEQKLAAAYRMALDVYYKAEELSRDPKHAHLLEHVEKMRRAHEEQYGKAIPERE